MQDQLQQLTLLDQKGAFVDAKTGRVQPPGKPIVPESAPPPPPERNALQITKPDGGGTFELDCAKYAGSCQKLREIGQRLTTASEGDRLIVAEELRIAQLEASNLVSHPPAGEAPLAVAPPTPIPSPASVPSVEPLHAVATYGIERVILDGNNYAILENALS